MIESLSAEPAASTTTTLDEFCPPHLRRAAKQLVPLLYADLKRIARSERNRHISPDTLNTTALVHDAFLRLSSSRGSSRTPISCAWPR
jgi:hypothetical protein